MTETTRTTVTLSRISMNEVKELVGVFGSTPASVISRIVDHFFDYGRFDDVIIKMKAKKRELYPPDDAIINERIKNLFKGADKIPFADFMIFSICSIERLNCFARSCFPVTTCKIFLPSKLPAVDTP